MTAACVGLIAGCVLRSRRDSFLWYDELATASLVSDRSWAHMVAAIAAGAENNPPLHQTLLWLWARLFGASELSLRMPSALAMSAAVVVMWVVARRGFQTRFVAAGIAVGMLTVPTVLDQTSQARFYGLFVLAGSLALAVTVEAMATESVTRRLIAALAVAHALLLYAHTFGVLFSGALAVALAASDVVGGRRRLAPYLGIAAGWLLYLPWVPVVLRQARAVAAPNSWLLRPTRDDLLALLGAQTRWLPIFAVAAVLIAALGSAARGEPSERLTLTGRLSYRRALAIAGPMLITVVPLVFVISRVAAPIFLDRYLLPAALGWVLIVAYLVKAPSSSDGSEATGRATGGLLWGLVFGIAAAYPVAHAAATPAKTRPDLALEPALRGLPIVVESGHQFWPLHHYAGAGGRVHYLLDWATASDPAAQRGSAQQYRLLELYAHQGYLAGSVEPAQQFFCANRRFIVVDDPGFLLYERRIANDPRLASRTVGRYGTAVVRLVEGRSAGCSAPAAPGP